MLDAPCAELCCDASVLLRLVLDVSSAAGRSAGCPRAAGTVLVVASVAALGSWQCRRRCCWMSWWCCLVTVVPDVPLLLETVLVVRQWMFRGAGSCCGGCWMSPVPLAVVLGAPVLPGTVDVFVAALEDMVVLEERWMTRWCCHGAAGSRGAGGDCAGGCRCDVLDVSVALRLCC